MMTMMNHYFDVNVTIICLLTIIYCPLQQSHSFFKLLSMLTEMQGGPPGMPSFTNLTLSRIWEVRVVTITYHFFKKISPGCFYFNITPVHLLALYKSKGLFHLFSLPTVSFFFPSVEYLYVCK